MINRHDTPDLPLPGSSWLYLFTTRARKAKRRERRAEPSKIYQCSLFLGFNGILINPVVHKHVSERSDEVFWGKKPSDPPEPSLSIMLHELYFLNELLFWNIPDGSLGLG